MKCNWKVYQSENRGCSFWVYEVLYVFFLHAYIHFVFSLTNFWVFFSFFFSFNTTCVLSASFKLFGKAAYYEI